MALFINTNISSINAQRHIVTSNKTLSTSSERLSSGLRINRAADDAAGLAISNRLTTQVRGLNQAIRNANDGISLIQTAEGALAESTNVLQRIRELSVQSANGIYSDTDRTTLDSEVQQLISELDRIAETTSFNGEKILNGNLSKLALQVGADAEQTIEFGIDNLDTSQLGLGSTSGDLVGSNMVLSGSGKIANAIGQDDVLINDQSIGALDAGASLENLIDSINENVNGVTASALIELEATSVGTGTLNDGDTLTLTLIKTDGNTQTYEITDTHDLEELANKITETTGGLVSASTDDDGKLVLQSDSLANLSVSDPTGYATGLGGGSISSGSVQQSVVNGLTSYWIREAEDLITTYFDISAPANTEIDLIFAETDGSLTGDVTGLSPAQQATIVSDGAGGSIAAVWNDPANLKLIIDLADFVSPEGSAPLYNDRVIAHEMVHAVFAATLAAGVNGALPGWFSEGIAEFIHGADSRVIGDINANTPPANPTSVGIGVIAASLPTAVGSPASSTGYSAGYIATKMLDEAISGNTGFAGIESIIDSLEAGNSLDAAITSMGINWGGGTGLAAFEAYYAATADEYISDGLNGTNTYAGVSVGGISSGLDLTDTDTGSVAGSDYGGATLTAESVLPNTASGGPINFDLTLPDGYSSSSSGGSAKLVLSSDHGDPITIERGQTGFQSDLRYLGLQTSSAAGSIQGVGITNPEESWSPGDIAINGVELDTEGTDSFAGKLAAINNISDQTGVSANAYASATLIMDGFDFDHWSTTNYGDFGLNGITITGIGDDTTVEEMTDTINGFTDETGVSAKVNGTNIILQANRIITIHDTGPLTGPDAAVAFGRADLGNAQILTSADDAANSAAEAVTDGTRVDVGIELISNDGASIQLELGDASSSTTGWIESNANSGGAFGTALSRIDVRTQSNAQRAIDVVDNALETINDTRSELGAANNRLDFTISSLANIMENSASARSRILDADFATETARLSSAQVKQQAASAMLAQANARPQAVLSLLQ